MTGDRRLYTLARRTLLDAFEALRRHVDSVILVGAQAVYVHAGEADIAVAPFTTDGDLAINPLTLADDPRLAEAMTAKLFVPHRDQIGTWVTSHELDGREHEVDIDLLVPATLGGTGRRGARLGVHGKKVARKARGLEAAVVDNSLRMIRSLEPEIDPRELKVKVAGPAALVVAKVIKIAERLGDTDRTRDKDALDVLRLLRAIAADDIGRDLAHLIGDPLSGVVTQEGVRQLEALFARRGGEGITMAVRAVTPLESADVVAESCLALTAEVLEALTARQK